MSTRSSNVATKPRMTDAQREVLLALNLRAMQMDNLIAETGVFTSEVARAAGRSNRSTAAILSMVRDYRWVRSCHGSDKIGWMLTVKGVAALEATR